MYTRLFFQLTVSLAFILSAQIALAQADKSQLLETIRDTAKDLWSFPIDVVIGNTMETYSDWDLRYDVRYSQFRQLYGLLLTAELSSKGEALECLEQLEEMTSKERALALTALYVYDRNHTSAFNHNVVERFYPDKNVPLDAALSDSERAVFIKALERYSSSDEVCFVREKESTLEDWEEDFRKQFCRFQSILRFTDHATAMRGMSVVYDPFLPKNASLRFLYALLVLETLNDELPSYDLSSESFTNCTRFLKGDLRTPSEIISPRELLDDVIWKSKAEAFEQANTRESFFEVIIMREFLRTQYCYTRLHGAEQMKGRCGDSSSERIDLGTIAQKILAAIEDEEEYIIQSQGDSAAEVTTAPAVLTSSEDESFLTFVRRISPGLTFFDASLVINRPERISAPNQPDLYVLFGGLDYETCYNLSYSVYPAFYAFCKGVEQATASEFKDAFDSLEELNAKEQALVLTALSYYVIRHERTKSRGEETLAIDKERLMNVLWTSTHSRDEVLFQLPAVDKKEWEKNFRNDMLFLQCLLGSHNPFLRMGCDPDELIQMCAGSSPRLLYALVAWELYSNLNTCSLPPIDDSVITRACELQRSVQEINQQFDISFFTSHDPEASQSFLSSEREMQLDVMREYLLSQFSVTRQGEIFGLSAGPKQGNVCNPPLTLGDVAKSILSCFEEEKYRRNPLGARERQFLKNIRNQVIPPRRRIQVPFP